MILLVAVPAVAALHARAGGAAYYDDVLNITWLGNSNLADTTLFRQQLGQSSVAPVYNPADLNCNRAVNSQDTARFRTLLGSPAGPSGFTN